MVEKKVKDNVKAKDEKNNAVILGVVGAGFLGIFLLFLFRKGKIIVSVNLPSASWSIAGPKTYSGTGNQTLEKVPKGEYIIIFSPVSGYTTPASQTKTLKAGETITFTGDYVSGQIGADVTLVEVY